MRRLVFGNIVVVCLLCVCMPLHAEVTGECSNCHTMHNSQGGQPMAYHLVNGQPVASSTPNPMLLVCDCIGCHTSDGTNTIVNGVPIVYNMVSPNKPLAGGNFYYVINNGNNRGHNVFGISGPDPNLGNTPPGGTSMSSQLRCAGKYGCHGDRTIVNQFLAMKGAHHTHDVVLDGSTVGKSYRFLKGVLGKEEPHWEHDATSSVHNEYQGATDFSTSTSISSLCAQCHGNFHSSTGVGDNSPWFRHPTDIILPNKGEYQHYNDDTLDYSLIAPVARLDPNSVADPSKVVPGQDVVMCLSCHRAHGSPYYKMLRWDYTNYDLDKALSGCSVCHTNKQ
ncbi:MAG: cytochrome c3 family protein [Desulfonauticus sp.]|nr:cytochrome c3 family protein [Desulfonauticus sp.]